MADQREAGTDRSLEEVFLSREFGRAANHRVTIDGWSQDAVDAPELEQVFLSESFGRPRVMTTPRPSPVPPQLVVPGGAVVASLHPPRENTRYRAIAAVSGIAAAALVVAGVASGGGTSRRPTVSAQSQSVRTGSVPGGEAPGDSSHPFPVAGPAAPAATTVAQSGGSSMVLASTSTPTVPTGARPSVVVEAPGTNVTVVPSPSPAAGGTTVPGATVSSASPPPTTSGSGNPVAPTTAVVGNTVTSVATTVTGTASEVGITVPAVAPLTGALGGAGVTLSGVGQMLTSTAT